MRKHAGGVWYEAVAAASRAAGPAGWGWGWVVES